MIKHFTTHTINCACHSLRSMFRVLGMYNFAKRVKQWIFERLEENDRIVVKAITAEAFKSSPDDFKHVSKSQFPWVMSWGKKLQL